MRNLAATSICVQYLLNQLLYCEVLFFLPFIEFMNGQ
jgi:hypothetical protein